MRLLETLSQGRSGERQSFIVFAEVEGAASEYKLVVPIQPNYLLVPLDEFSGSATFVAQVDRILRDTDEVLAVRLVRNSPLLPVERKAVHEVLPNFSEMFAELGVDSDENDFVRTKPAVVLKPICIYK